MATGVTKLADVIVPEHFTLYVQQLTEEKSRIIASGAAVRDNMLDSLLSQGGNAFSDPSWQDLDNEDENISSDDETSDSTPSKMSTSKEIQVRMSRNKSWSSMDLTSALAGADATEAISSLVAGYWVRRDQKAFVASVTGVFADNAAAPSGEDTHTAGDMTHDVSQDASTPGQFEDGVTNFTATGFINATLTMGDGMESLTMMLVHSTVYARMQILQLIIHIPDARGETLIATYQGREVIVDDGMPRTGNVYDTWLFGAGAIRIGYGTPAVPTELERKASSGDGGGQDILHSRLERIIHPTGHAFLGTITSGGPSNAATAGNLAAAGSWSRVWPERKQIKIGRFVSREA